MVLPTLACEELGRVRRTSPQQRERVAAWEREEKGPQAVAVVVSFKSPRTYSTAGVNSALSAPAISSLSPALAASRFVLPMPTAAPKLIKLYNPKLTQPRTYALVIREGWAQQHNAPSWLISQRAMQLICVHTNNYICHTTSS